MGEGGSSRSLPPTPGRRPAARPPSPLPGPQAAGGSRSALAGGPRLRECGRGREGGVRKWPAQAGVARAARGGAGWGMRRGGGVGWWGRVPGAGVPLCSPSDGARSPEFEGGGRTLWAAVLSCRPGPGARGSAPRIVWLAPSWTGGRPRRDSPQGGVLPKSWGAWGFRPAATGLQPGVSAGAEMALRADPGIGSLRWLRCAALPLPLPLPEQASLPSGLLPQGFVFMF